MNERVTLADISREVGCAKSTVSMALRGNQAIPTVTRDKIHAVCQRLGYHPNPLLASLASQRFRSTKTVSDIPLAFISTNLQEYKEEVALASASVYAPKLGYKISSYPVEELKALREPGRVLYTRGIQGILLPTFFDPSLLPHMDWTLFSVVALGHPLQVFTAAAGFHRVTEDHYETVIGA